MNFRAAAMIVLVHRIGPLTKSSSFTLGNFWVKKLLNAWRRPPDRGYQQRLRTHARNANAAAAEQPSKMDHRSHVHFPGVFCESFAPHLMRVGHRFANENASKQQSRILNLRRGRVGRALVVTSLISGVALLAPLKLNLT